MLDVKNFCPFLDEFAEARKDLFSSKKSLKDNFSLLRKFFTFLKENGVETMEESFFDEDRTQLAIKYVQEIQSWKVSKAYFCRIRRMARDFAKYCVEEHSLISYDQVRKENANKMLQVLFNGTKTLVFTHELFPKIFLESNFNFVSTDTRDERVLSILWRVCGSQKRRFVQH